MCVACEAYTSSSTPDRMTCECHRLAGGGQEYEHLYFDTLLGLCQAVPADFVTTSSVGLVDSVLTKHSQHECEPGYYCIDGIRRQCPAGSYGSRVREVDASCQGICQAGYYCPPSSTSPTQEPCGTGPELYCPEGSSTPTAVMVGYYTNEDRDETLRSSQLVCPIGHFCPGDGRRYLCPAGTHGTDEALTTSSCSGPCPAGYYCPGDTGSAVRCGGSSHYCPEGSSAPQEALPGYYTIATGIDAELVALRNQNSTQSAQIPCEPGFWCNHGQKYQCREGTYGWETATSEQSQCLACPEGHYCPSYPGPPTSSARLHQCGGINWYCPLGSAAPIKVSVGYYTSGGLTDMVQSQQLLCEQGHYCKGGVKQPCAAGLFGSEEGLSTEQCNGFCPAGYECPTASEHPVECRDGQYATAGAYKCIDCPHHTDGTVSQCKDARRCCSQTPTR
ncbi:unnamed protein product [Chrysoparadoxa australica]